MITLMIHLATDPGLIAITKDSHCLIAVSRPISRRGTEGLTPFIVDLCAQVDLTFGDLTRIVVTQGPGSYTSSRVGITVAKVLATTLGIPVVALSTLEAFIWSHFDHNGIYLSMLETRWPSHVVALFRVFEGQVSRLSDDVMWTFPTCLPRLNALHPDVFRVGRLRPEFTPSTCLPRVTVEGLLAFSSSPTAERPIREVQPIYAHPAL